MEPLFEPIIRPRSRLRDDNATTTSSPEASADDNEASEGDNDFMSDDEQNPWRQERDVTPQSGTHEQSSIQTILRDEVVARSNPSTASPLSKLKDVGNYDHRRATQLSDIFPTTFQTRAWNQTSYTCIHCQRLARWIYTTTQRSRTSEFDDMNLVDTIELEASRGCGNCQFMLGCLRKAVFSPESPKTVRFTHRYRLMLYDEGIREECLLKLESGYGLYGFGKFPRLVGKLESRHNPHCDLGMYSYSLASCSLVVCNADGYDKTKLNKYIDKDPRSAKSVSLVSQWLGECQNHENCPPQTEKPLPTRVINIPDMPGVNPSLWITCGIPGKYIAFSHCWGGLVPVTTTIDTIKDHESEIVLKDLPRSFRDAIDIAQMLGFKYLWIDSLCIIQDSVEDWASECSKMAAVYTNATLVIGAVAAADSTQGFLNPRNFLQGPPLGDVSKYFLRENIKSRKDQTSSPLFSRAWAYQEALLAPRLLLYASSRMSWECRHGIKDEGANVVVSSNTSCSKKQFYRTIDSTLPTSSIQIDLKGEQPTRANQSCPLLINSVCSRLNTWCGCVEDYSLRQLTRASDKLPALSGLACKIHDPTMGEYLAGIWSKDLGTGLFWARHTAREGLYSRPFFKYPDYRAPSWSWASCEGPVNFRVEHATSSRPAIATDAAFVSDVWKEQYDTKLVDYKMLLATSDKYGQVLEGSYITLEGLSRIMYPYHPAPKSPEKETDDWRSPYAFLAEHDGSFTIRLDHPSGVQEKHTWLGTETTPGSRVLLILSASRCLILKYFGNDSWERDGCCVLPSEECPSNNGYSGWAKSKFKLV